MTEYKRITKEELSSLLTYDPLTGVFLWKESGAGRRRNLKAGGFDSDGSIGIMINGVSHKAHKLAWIYHCGAMPEKQIDHINRDRSDNRIDNLRDVSSAENCRNRGIGSDNKSGVNGVYKNKPSNKWHVQIKVKGKRIHLGMFDEIKDAAEARAIAEEKYFKSTTC